MATELKEPSLDAGFKRVVEWLQSEQCKKVAVFAGAGISVSAGIPDFRSKDGFYNTLDVSK